MSLFSDMGRKTLILILRLFLGLIFIFSGVVKLYPVESFELTLVDLGLFSWASAPYASRLLIALELFLGILLVFNIRLKQFAIKATILLLALFILYLTYEIIKNGNHGNCGCFGSFIEMTPLQAIIKNIILIILLLILNGAVENRAVRYKWVFYAILFAAIITPFILVPPDWVYYRSIDTGFIGRKLEFEKLPPIDSEGKEVDLNHGNYIVAFLSVKCPHCKVALKKLVIIDHQINTPPVYLVLMGERKYVSSFLEEAGSHFPYIYYNEKEFLDLSGPYFPTIYYVENGVVKKRWDNVTIHPDEIKNIAKSK